MTNRAAGFQQKLRARRTEERSEGGFTLIELLVVVVIMPLVVGAITVALLAVFSQQTTVSNRLSGSGDAQIVSASFVSDVQSAAMVTTNSAPVSPALAHCGSAPQVLGLQWTGGLTEISYDVVPAGNTFNLVREYCQNGNTTPVNNTVMSHDVLPGLTPTILGSPCPTCTPTATSAALGWTTTAGVSSVTFSITEPASNFKYSLAAAPRLTTPASRNVGGGGHAPLLLLGTGSQELSCAGNGSLSVTGDVVLNSTSNPGALTSGNGGVQINSGSVFTDSPNPAGALSGNISGYSALTPLSSPVPDPYQNPPLVPPATGLPVTTGNTYQGFNVYHTGNYQGPGIYVNTLTFTSSTVMASGIYILEAGLSASGNPGTSITSGPGGVFIYVFGGQFSTTGNAAWTLNPLSSPPSPAANLVIWQDMGDTLPVYLAGNSGGSLVGGTVYAPGATLGGSGNGNLNVSSVVAKGLACDGNGGISIG
jgi:prepilin-type N-terminal cleavage/methylation domain-containing protein